MEKNYGTEKTSVDVYIWLVTRYCSRESDIDMMSAPSMFGYSGQPTQDHSMHGVQ